MSSTRLHELQAYPEWTSREATNEVIRYIQSRGTNRPYLPHFISSRERNRWYEKFNSNDWHVLNNQLYYHPSDRINLVVATPEQHHHYLDEAWHSIDEALGDGTHTFYNYISQHYLGITRQQCINYLQQQGDYTLHINHHKQINQPLLAKCPNERWEIDCVDMARYGNNPNAPVNQFNINQLNDHGTYRYILCGIDVFSHYVFARALRSLTANEVLQAFQSMMTDSNTHPHIVQTDNGRSFSGEFHQYIVNWNATHPPQEQMLHIFTAPYTPTSNGMIERANQNIRRKIKAVMIHENSLEWVQHLPAICENINNQRSSTTRHTPKELWTQGYHPLAGDTLVNFGRQITDHSNQGQIQHHARVQKFRQEITRLQDQRNHQYQIGERVRLSLQAFSPEFRRRIKEHNYVQYNAIYYTPEIYTITHVYPFRPAQNINIHNDVNGELWGLRNTQYSVCDSDNVPVYASVRNHIVKRFYGSEMTPIALHGFQQAHITTNDRGRVINRFIRDTIGFVPPHIRDGENIPEPIEPQPDIEDEPQPPEPESIPVRRRQPRNVPEPIVHERFNPREQRRRIPNRFYQE